jgi:hypothetical protein
MNFHGKMRRRQLIARMVGATTVLTMGHAALAATSAVTLSGGQEVPPVRSAATGSGTVTIADDGAVTGTIRTTGIAGTGAHIHEGAVGKNGPVVVPMVKNGDGSWTFAPNAKLTPAQFAAYRSGELYVNVHSSAHPDGEIRGQLKP